MTPVILVEIAPGRVPRLIGKRGTMIQTIETATDLHNYDRAENGRVVVACDDAEGLLKAKKAIRMVKQHGALYKPD